MIDRLTLPPNDDEPEDTPCPLCNDTGEIWSDERDESGNIRRDVNVKPCPHCKQDED